MCIRDRFQTAGSNATAVNKQITAQIDEMRKSLPEGTEFVTMMSSNDFLYADVYKRQLLKNSLLRDVFPSSHKGISA